MSQPRAHEHAAASQSCVVPPVAVHVCVSPASLCRPGSIGSVHMVASSVTCFDFVSVMLKIIFGNFSFQTVAVGESFPTSAGSGAEITGRFSHESLLQQKSPL